MKSNTRRHYETVVARAVADVRSALDGTLDLRALGKRAGLSPLHFHHIFRGLLGETPLEMCRRLRLERAAVTLATGDEPMTRVAFEAGYETHESFTRAFGDAFATSPSQFRAAARAQSVPWTAATKGTLAATSGIHITSATDAEPVFLIGKESPMKVKVTSLSARRVLAVAHRGPYNAVSESFAKLDAIVRPSGLLAHGSLGLVAIFHDDPEVTPASELRADVGLLVPDDVPKPKGLRAYTIPAGLYAKTMHQGPYQTLGDTWGRLMGPWLVQSGYRVGRGPAYECYLNTPGNASPGELKTELCLSIAEAREE
jgi:AraC family transcriptional regulator